MGGGRRAPVTTVLVPAGAATVGTRCRLDDDEAHHLRVRRVSPGDAVTIRDGAGLLGRGTVALDGDAWTVEIERAEAAPALPELVVAVGAGDRDRFAWLVEKAAELGVTTVVPIEASRTASVATRLQKRHVDKLRRQALEALKQSGAAWVTAIEDPVSLDRFLADRVPGARWLADASGDAPPATPQDQRVTVMVGPEGGFTGAERGAIVLAGYRPVRLGPHTLRFETAALAAAAAVHATRHRRTDG